MRSFLIAAPLSLAASAVLLATPVSAATGWHNAGQLRAQISQLDRQVDQAQHRGSLSGREADRLERQVDQLQNLYLRYARGGFTRGELATLGSRIDSVKAQVFAQDHDRGHARNDRDDRGHDRNGSYRR